MAIALLRRVDRCIAAVETAIAVAAITAILFLVSWQVPLRLLELETRRAIVERLGGPGGLAQSLFGDFSWMTPVARFLLLWAAFLGASLATRRRRHILIDAVTKLIPSRRVQAGLNVPAAIVAALLCAFLAYVGAFVVSSNWAEQTVLRGLRLGPVQVVIPVGFAVMAFRFVIVALEDLRGAVTGDLAYLREYEAATLGRPESQSGERAGAQGREEKP